MAGDDIGLQSSCSYLLSMWHWLGFAGDVTVIIHHTLLLFGQFSLYLHVYRLPLGSSVGDFFPLSGH